MWDTHRARDTHSYQCAHAMSRTIAGRKISDATVRAVTLFLIFALVPPWDTTAFIIVGFYFVLTICLLARVVLWLLVSFSIINKWKDTKRAVGATAVAFIVLIPIEMLYFMTLERYLFFTISAFIRLIGGFVLLVTVGSVKKQPF